MFEVDMAWHIASVASMLKWNYHFVVDTWFWWYISHLFYPPLEAWITSIIKIISGLNLVVSYKIYLTVLLVWYIATIMFFSRNFKKKLSKIIFLSWFLILIFWWNDGLQYFQWLIFYDFFVTWLTSEFLGAIFLRAIIYMLYKYQNSEFKNKQLFWISIFTALSISWHIVIWAAVLCILFVESIRRRDRKFAISVLIWLLMSAFVRLPTLIYSSQMVSWTILENNIDIFLVLVWLLVLSTKRKDFSWTIIISIIIMTILPSLWYWLQTKFGFDILPPFHYSRLSIISWSLLIIAIADMFEKLKQSDNQKYIKRFTVILLFIFMIKNHRIWLINQHKNPNTDSTNIYTYTDSIIKETKKLLIWTNKRVLSVDIRSPIAFSFDSLFVIVWSDIQFVKWLFWESTINNSILSTYLVNFFDNNDSSIVNSLYYNYTNCDRMKSYFDNFVQDYNIWAIIAPDIELPTYMKVNSKTCYIDILKRWTKHLDVQKIYEFQFRWHRHFLYSVKPRYEYTHQFMDIAIPNSIQNIYEIKKDDNFIYNIAINLDQKASIGYMDDYIYVFDNKKWQSFMLNIKNYKVYWTKNSSIKKISNGVFEINIDSDEDVLFIIKMNYFPGRKLYDNNKNLLPLFESPQGMLAYGKWKIILIYEKPLIYKFGYLTSILSLLVSLIFIYFDKKRKKINFFLSCIKSIGYLQE